MGVLQPFARLLAVVGFAAQFCPDCRELWDGKPRSLFAPHGHCPLLRSLADRGLADIERNYFGVRILTGQVAGLVWAVKP